MDEWKTRLQDSIAAPPGFTDDVMAAIQARRERQPARGSIYSPMAKGILCIAAAALLLVLSMPRLDTAWDALAKIGPGLRVIRETQRPSIEDDGLMIPGKTVLQVINH